MTKACVLRRRLPSPAPRSGRSPDGDTTVLTRLPLALLPAYLVVATALGFVDYRMRTHPDRGFDAYPQAVVANTEEPPGKYRVLAPYLFESVVRATGIPRDVLWVLFRWVCLLGGLLATHVLLSTWADATTAFAGALLSGVLLLLTFTNSWGHPDHLVEWAVLTAGLVAVARQHFVWAVVWLLVAALNRETSFVLVLWWMVARPVSRDWLWTSAGLSAVWAAVYVGLRWWRGVAWYDPWQADRNLEFLGLLPPGYDPYYRAYAWFGVILVALALGTLASSWSRQPRLTRGGTLVVLPAFVTLAFLFSSIIETRIFTPLLPMLTLTVMFACTPADRMMATT